MGLSICAPADASAKIFPSSQDAVRRPSIVIHQTTNLCSEAVEAVVRKFTRWHVAGVTSNIGFAAAAAIESSATALLIGIDSNAVVDLESRCLRLRRACPEVQLILLTDIAAVGLYVGPPAVSAIIHADDGVTALISALGRVECDSTYQSPKIRDFIKYNRRSRQGFPPSEALCHASAV